MRILVGREVQLDVSQPASPKSACTIFHLSRFGVEVDFLYI